MAEGCLAAIEPATWWNSRSRRKCGALDAAQRMSTLAAVTEVGHAAKGQLGYYQRSPLAPIQS